MSYLISILVFLLLFSILILVHEFGHFFAARKCGVKIDEFGMGLPPRAKGLWTDKKGTLYSLNWIPFGGFVRMFGEDSSEKEMWKQKGSFGSKSIPARTIIILGGVLMNFLLGYVILVLLFTVGTKPFIATQEDFQYYRDQGVIIAEDQVLITDFAEDSQADEAGLVVNDVILSADQLPVRSNDEFVAVVQDHAGKSVLVTVLRDGGQLNLSVPVSTEGHIGVVISDAPRVDEIHEVSYSFPQALVQAGYEVGRLSILTMKLFVQVLVDLFTSFQVSDQISGPVGIAQLTHMATQSGGIWEVLKLMALLSISLGAINVLPIPALDGGRFLSIVFEIITRKRPNPTWEARIHAIGFLIIIILILAVTYNDILRLITG
ncbi:MAG: site-2 protease family protein [bacterium]|nr:site-2 protease family protein [bacterium]